MSIAYCLNCKQNVYTKREDLNIGLLIVLCIFTGGFGAFIYLIIYYSKEENRCIYCNSICKSNATNPQFNIKREANHSLEINGNDNYQNYHRYQNHLSYCPDCGKELKNYVKTPNKLNFCPYCGKNLSEYYKQSKIEEVCTICHQKIKVFEETINCSYCGSPYHYTCVSNWLSKYNSCPMCQNIFMNPDLKTVEN